MPSTQERRAWIVPLCAMALVSFGPTAAFGEPVNVAAMMGTATQSTTQSSYVAGLALDGNLTNFTHTTVGDPNPTWEVDLGRTLPIEAIVLFNRSSCCRLRLQDITVSILDAEDTPVVTTALLNPGNELQGPASIAVGLIALGGERVPGQKVRVARTPNPEIGGGDGSVLSLAEVEVYADSSSLPVSILTHPQDARKYVGECHVFSVGLRFPENAASISYEWLKDDEAIPGATGPRLTLAGIQEVDTGVYKVVVTADEEVLTSEPATLVVPGRDLALYGTATQSSVDAGGVPERAIDGNTNGAWSSGTITHTLEEPGSWWQVELHGKSTVERVVLWNRTDACCANRLSNFRVMAIDIEVVGEVEQEVQVWGADFFTDLSFPDTASFEINLPADTTCRTIRVQRLGPDPGGKNILSLAEVEVFGDGPLPPDDPFPNLARTCGAFATQSSQYGAYPAARAVDGDYSSFTHTATTDESPSWQVELPELKEIAIIALYNRSDCCGSRLRDITVSILGGEGDPVWVSELLNPENELGTFPNGPSRLWVDLRILNGGPVMGQTVLVERTPDPDLSGTGGEGNEGEAAALSLAEVEIYGVPPWCAGEEGDTHCNSLTVEGPGGDLPGVYSATASATDDSGDEIIYTFTADNGVDAPLVVGPQTSEVAVFELLTAGTWTVSVTVDDDELCLDEAENPTCSGEVSIVIPGENLALAGTASQSTTNGSYTADLAIDGNLGNFTHTSSADLAPSWQVDLGVEGKLYAVLLHNRDSCCGSRLRDITVSVLDTGGGVAWESPLLNPENEMGEYPLGPPILTVDLAGANDGPVAGSVVRVTRTPDPDLSGSGGEGNEGELSVISLGEVVVYGTTCPAEGDTHCTGLTVEPTGSSDGTTVEYLATATASDDSGDAIAYTFTATADGMDPVVVGPQSESTALLDLRVGSWTVTVELDDDPSCDDVADNATCEATVEVAEPGVGPFQRGDANADGNMDLSDGVFILNFLFVGGAEPPCKAAADANSEGGLSLTSGIYVLNHLFLGGPPPAAPFPGCGLSNETSDVELGCDNPHTNCP